MATDYSRRQSLPGNEMQQAPQQHQRNYYYTAVVHAVSRHRVFARHARINLRKFEKGREQQGQLRESRQSERTQQSQGPSNRAQQGRKEYAINMRSGPGPARGEEEHGMPRRGKRRTREKARKTAADRDERKA